MPTSQPTWHLIHTLPHTTPPHHFQSVMQNLLLNPNITSSLLFRAEIYYDSNTDSSATWGARENNPVENKYQHVKEALRKVNDGRHVRGDNIHSNSRTTTIINDSIESVTPSGANANANANANAGNQDDDDDAATTTHEPDVFTSTYIQHMRSGLRPRGLGGPMGAGLDPTALALGELQGLLEGRDGRPIGQSDGRRGKWKWKWQKTVVRNLVPRNPQRDAPCAQSCWYFQSFGEDDEDAEKRLVVDANQEKKHEGGVEENADGKSRGEQRDLVIYIPHVDRVEDVPFYHPACRGLATLHTFTPSQQQHTSEEIEGKGTISIFYSLFPGSTLSNRLSRTAINIVATVAKHCAGRAAGYVKRVHHDRVVPQKAVQDTYTRLKAKYAKPLIDGWVESTDPSKHVFEDLGIAAFLIGLWDRMYKNKGLPHPGFVDFGCGNGVLVYILLAEGYEGWGFDIRKRKTWDALPQDVVAGKLLEKTCVPQVLQDALGEEGMQSHGQGAEFYNGMLTKGTFIISNHADELTPWTPLLAYMSGCPFIAIPCCSHDFGGNRFRAKPGRTGGASSDQPGKKAGTTPATDAAQHSGELQKRNAKAPSAYASLCSWVERLTEDVGFVAEQEVLRIPSTRNVAVLGREREQNDDAEAVGSITMEKVRHVIEREMSRSVESIAAEWVERSRKIATSKGNSGGH